MISVEILKERIARLKSGKYLNEENATFKNIVRVGDASLNEITGDLVVDNIEYPCVRFLSEEQRLKVKRIYMQNKIIAFLDDQNADIYGVFSGCENLKQIVFSPALKVINESMFENCVSLENVRLPKNLLSVEVAGFNNCKRLKRVEFPESLQTIEDESFANCFWLKEIYIPKNLISIGDYAFENCFNINEIVISEDNQTYADYDANIIANKQTKTLLFGCKNSSVPNGIEIVGENAFNNCRALKEISIPSSVKWIELSAFSHCVNLENIRIEEGLKRIEAYAFTNCKKLKNVHFPTSLEFIGKNAFEDCVHLDEIKIYTNCEVRENNWDLLNPKKLTISTGKNEYDFSKIHLEEVDYSNCGIGLIIKDYDGNVYYANKNGELISNKYSALTLKNDNTRNNELNKLELKDIHKIIEWNKYPFVPHYTIVQNMPTQEIPLFFKDNNAKNWFLLRKIANQKNREITDEQRKSFFTFAHALGVFSESGKESEIATNFIAGKILEKYSLAELHQKLSGWDSANTPYCSEFAKFFIKYYDEYNLLNSENMESEKELANYMPAIHNRFAEVISTFPHKKVQTRQRSEQITPDLVLNVVSQVEYENVEKGCEKLAQTVKRFGYTQKEYEILQTWFLIGLKEKENMLKVDADKSEYMVQYELMQKSNPLCAVLGNITNCCQVVNDNGKHCLRYGITMPNSNFVVFKMQEHIIGQAWIWYDEQTKQVTLDNIEMPASLIEKVLKNAEIKDAFLMCVERFCLNIMQKMNENQNMVDAVTIGLGYNKIGVELVKKYGIIKNAKKLTTYANYTDANKQSLICKTPASKLEVMFPNKEELKKIKENELLLVY